MGFLVISWRLLTNIDELHGHSSQQHFQHFQEKHIIA
jgi:hypothetical protein